MTYALCQQEATRTASLSAAAKDANVILAVTTHVKQNNNITFTDDNGLVPLFERWSYEGLRKGKFNSVFNYTNWAVWVTVFAEIVLEKNVKA